MMKLFLKMKDNYDFEGFDKNNNFQQALNQHILCKNIVEHQNNKKDQQENYNKNNNLLLGQLLNFVHSDLQARCIWSHQCFRCPNSKSYSVNFHNHLEQKEEWSIIHHQSLQLTALTLQTHPNSTSQTSSQLTSN